jgi:phosphoenolpyruvate phosphomutase
MSETPYLKPLLGRGRPIWVMGAHDVLSAKIVERAGFDAVGVQSLQIAFVNGLPDIGIIGPEELVRICRRIRAAVSLPIVVDFEQGFGEPYVAVHWMKELEAAGVAAVHIDDYGLPYKCPFIPPHVLGLEDIDATADKIRAMAGPRRSGVRTGSAARTPTRPPARTRSSQSAGRPSTPATSAPRSPGR